MKIKDSFKEVFGDKEKVLVVTAHPDDNEIICGGLVARLIAEGKKVRLVVTTNGEKGMIDEDVTTAEFGARRIKEQLAAAKELGLSENEVFNLDIPDGELEVSVENIGEVVFHIRQFQPEIVITHCPDEVINTYSEDSHWVNHRDHRHTGLVTTDASYPYSRDRGFFPGHFEQGLEPWTVKEVMFSDAYTHPQRVYLDITDYIDKKRKALACCKSVIEKGTVEEYVEENKIGDKYFEVLRYVKIY